MMINAKGCLALLAILAVACFLLYATYNTISGWF